MKMKKHIISYLIESLIAIIIVAVGLAISKTFLSGMICGIIYYSLVEIIEYIFKEREDK